MGKIYKMLPIDYGQKISHTIKCDIGYPNDSANKNELLIIGLEKEWNIFFIYLL